VVDINAVLCDGYEIVIAFSLENYIYDFSIMIMCNTSQTLGYRIQIVPLLVSITPNATFVTG
jgi:hypothetical protein